MPHCSPLHESSSNSCLVPCHSWKAVQHRYSSSCTPSPPASLPHHPHTHLGGCVEPGTRTAGSLTPRSLNLGHSHCLQPVREGAPGLASDAQWQCQGQHGYVAVTCHKRGSHMAAGHMIHTGWYPPAANVSFKGRPMTERAWYWHSSATCAASCCHSLSSSLSPPLTLSAYKGAEAARETSVEGKDV
jgi:hypothetical protein